MKKIYAFLLAMLAVGTMSARELTFYMGDSPIANGSTVAYTDTEVKDLGDGWKSVKIAPPLYLWSDLVTKTVKVTAACTSGQVIQMCAGSKCEAGTSVTKNNVTINTREKLDLEFHFENPEMQGDVPTITVKFDAEDTSYGTTASFTLVMGPNSSGIREIAKDKEVWASPAGIEYNLNAPANISLYSITGTQVLAVKAEGRGTVNTHSLRPGIYIYTVTTSAGARTTGKIHVR
ncbi:MAG: T9SS type A sorting domain-containing protein [Muribaculaceae bacterium]|nr:T9SS type A sorting domain-containing protein [Muribaculaceae bacterium]